VELLHVRGVRACLQQQTINELSQRVEALQGRLTMGEASLARENPPVFQYVQVRMCVHTCLRVIKTTYFPVNAGTAVCVLA
jgi:hypothetical protein